jgi:uncharacterized membrane protein
MKETLTVVAMHMVTIIHAMALLVVAFGTVQAFVRSFRAMVQPSSTGRHFHAGYIQYARWLVGALTFQLAADIVESALAPSWDEIGRLAAIAAIRTFLNFFLERDLAQLEKREAASSRLTVTDGAP